MSGTKRKYTEHITKMDQEVTNLLDEVFEALPHDSEAMARVEHFLQGASLSATKGMFMIFLEFERNVLNRVMKLPSNDQMIDMQIFVSYVLLAKNRVMRYGESGRRGGRIADFMQTGLELFALYEDRPFPFVYLINELIKDSKDGSDR